LVFLIFVFSTSKNTYLVQKKSHDEKKFGVYFTTFWKGKLIVGVFEKTLLAKSINIMSRASARIIGGQSVLDAEGREERRIAGMRQRNEQRRNRFLNAKVRVMGVDNLGIEQQKAEKLARKAAEKEADMTYSREQQMIRDLVEANLAKEQRDEYEGKRSIAEYNLQAQDKSMRREYDLNDPRGLQKERKTTCAALEATGSVGPSSMLQFAGEDRNYGDRQKMMQAQMRDWTSQQKAMCVSLSVSVFFSFLFFLSFLLST
jgi:hypothetical protein